VQITSERSLNRPALHRYSMNKLLMYAVNSSKSGLTNGLNMLFPAATKGFSIAVGWSLASAQVHHQHTLEYREDLGYRAIKERI
jgi:hypothetical protein